MDEARSIIFAIMKVGAGLFVLGLVLVFAGSWSRRRHVATHGEDSLPPRQPYIWESIPVRDRWILAIFIGGCILLGFLLRSLH